MSGHPFSEEFFKETVEPTVDEYLAQPQDIRRGRLAAIVLEHMVDYWHQDTHEKKDDVSREPFFDVARHRQLTRYRLLSGRIPSMLKLGWRPRCRTRRQTSHTT